MVRKVSGWELPSILDEYRWYAEPKVRDCDIRYISAFELSSLAVPAPVREPGGRAWSLLRLRHFFRLTFFSLFVVLLWLWSGKKMVAQRPIRPGW